jgi:DNA gyrase/topoisomerase IV subunit B
MKRQLKKLTKKLSQREHVLRRSGVYVGDIIKKKKYELWF